MLLNLLWHNTDLIVCVKPAGVSSEECDGLNMISLLREQTGSPTVFPVHRLDLPTAGLMVYALTKKSAAFLSAQLTDGTLQKEYLCVADGVPPAPSGTWTDWLYYDRVRGKSFPVDRARAGVKQAILSYTLLQTVPLDTHALSLLRVRLTTGRTHQIRVQMASRGMPLVGDRKYGSVLPAEHLALLSQTLRFRDMGGHERVFTLPLPEDYPWQYFRL